jgi:hypothetical protein
MCLTNKIAIGVHSFPDELLPDHPVHSLARGATPEMKCEAVGREKAVYKRRARTRCQ